LNINGIEIDNSQAEWKYLLSFGKSSAILYLGEPNASVLYSLNRDFGLVVYVTSLQKNWEYAIGLKKVFEWLHFYPLLANLAHLPFKQESFRCLYLRWPKLAKNTLGDGRELKETTLIQARTILKPKGQIVLTGDNTIPNFLQRLLKRKKHFFLPFNSEVRRHIFALRKIGFQNIYDYWLYPHSYAFNWVLPRYEVGLFETCLKQILTDRFTISYKRIVWFVGVFLRLGLLKYFPGGYLILATK